MSWSGALRVRGPALRRVGFVQRLFEAAKGLRVRRRAKSSSSGKLLRTAIVE